MRYVLALLLAAPAVVAQDPFLTGSALQAEVTRDCSDGCMVMTRAQMAEFERQLQMMLFIEKATAYEAGKAAERAACLSLI